MPNGAKIVRYTGVVAGESLTSSQYHAVYMSSETEVSECDSGSVGKQAIGILLNAPASGEPAEVATFGSLNVLYKVDGNASAISIGDKIKANESNSGIGLKTTTDTDVYIAIAREASSADDDLIKVDIVEGMYAG